MRKIVDFLIGLFTLAKGLFLVYIIMFIISLPALPFILGKYINLTCNRVETSYVICQQQHFHLYGLWSEPVTPPLRVTSVAIKEYKINSEGISSTGYKLYLNSENESKELYDYSDDANKALNTKKIIDDFIWGNQKKLQIRINENIGSEIFLIVVGACYVLIIINVLVFVGEQINILMNQMARRKRF